MSIALFKGKVKPSLHAELWTSWASLLRSYTGAHGLNSTHHVVVEIGPTEIILCVDTRSLRFTPTSLTSSMIVFLSSHLVLLKGTASAVPQPRPRQGALAPEVLG